MQAGPLDSQDGDKSPLPELTQLSSHDFKFTQIDFHAEFISQPLGGYSSVALSSRCLQCSFGEHTKAAI